MNSSIGSSVTTVVNDGLPQGWAFAQENTPGGTGAFVAGPATPPLGVGSANITTPTNANGMILGKLGYTGTPLSSFTLLSYNSYQASTNPVATPNLQIVYDFDTTDGITGFQGRLVFEPYHTTGLTVSQSTWQDWSPLLGKWWASPNAASLLDDACPQALPCTWNQIINQFPNAAVHPNPLFGSVLFKAGSGAGTFTGNVDNFTIGIGGNNTTFDFEPSNAIVVDVDGFASATDCDDAVTPAATTIAAAHAAAIPGDTIRVCPGTYPAAPTVALNKAGVTIIGVGPTKPVIQTASAGGNLFLVTAPNVTINNLEVQKTDVADQGLIAVQANNFTAQNNLIYGPNPGGTWNDTGFVSRAFVVSTSNNLNISNNVIHTLRQPAYMSGNATSGGTISGNNVSGTKGWVVEGGNFAFSANTWGEPQNQDCDIALLPSVAPANVAFYQPLLSLSLANDNAFVCAQYPGGENGRRTVFVDNSFPLNGSDNAPYEFIQHGVNGALAGGEVQVAAGTYIEDININKTLTVTGADSATTIISGAIGGDGATVRITGNNVEISGFTITRQGNNTTDWNNPGLNTVGVAIQGQAVLNALIHDNVITGNRTGIDINNSNGHTVRNNAIDNNHTGVIFRNQTDNMTFVENFVTNNRTVGVLFLDASGGSNVPVQTALNSTFLNNNISGNWYGEIVDRQSGGSLPAPGANQKSFAGNWFGSISPVVTTANSAEPGYAAQIPVIYGGTATDPGGQPDIAGPASANFIYSPFLNSGTDTNIETVPGRGIFGFQGGDGSITITPTGSPTALDNDYTRINNAVQAAVNGDTIVLSGTFDWTEPNAAASWALGSDGIGGNDDDYTVLAPANLNGVTVTAAALGTATIQGPGDLAAANLEGVFQFFAGGTNQNWTISNLRILDFDNPIGFYHAGGPTTAYSGTQIINNHIRTARDLNATVAPADVNQNIGIHFAFGTNQTISGNLIEMYGDGVSNGSNFSTEVAMQSNTSGGAVYNGLQITNNTLNVLNAQSANPQVVLGIWENAHGHLSNITVSGNQFNNLGIGNDPALNIQRAFRITSHSGSTTTVTYSGNSVSGANIGFQWLAGSNFTGNQPVQLTSNSIVNGGTGVLVDSNGLLNASFNRIAGNSVAGLNNLTAGAVNAENNWWGCNYGPGASGAGCPVAANAVLGTADANPWLTLTTSATPNSIPNGGNSAVTSSLTINSDAVDTSGSGSVPNGTPATFAGTNGTVAPPSSTTTAGVTGTTFTANAYGVGGAATTIDGQTVSAAITVVPVCATVTIPTGITTLTNQQVMVPLNVDDLTGRNVISFDYTVTYNSSVLTYLGVETVGTLSNGMTITVNSNTPGILVVSGFTATPLTGAGTLINLRFFASGAINSTSPVNFSAFTFNDGNPCSQTNNGSVNVISSTSTGRVTYANAVVDTPVPYTDMNGAGSTPVSDQTDLSGNYTLSGFGPGAYTVTPSKTGDVNGINSFDAARIAQHVVGTITLNSTQLLAADVSNSVGGTVNSFDAALIAQWIVFIPNPGVTGTWRFIPANRNYASLATPQVNQDFAGILMGDVNGDWVAPTTFSGLWKADRVPSKNAIEVSAPSLTAAPGTDLTVPVSVQDLTEKGVISYQFDLLYDPTVLEPHQVAADLAGSISEGMVVVSNSPEPGLLKVAIFGPTPINGKGLLLNLRFSVIGSDGTGTSLVLRDLMLNDGSIEIRTVDGQLAVSAANDDVSIGGQLLTATGQGIANARVVITSTTGESRSVVSNSFGSFVFGGLQSGETYTLNARAKGHTIGSQTVVAADGLTKVDLIAGK